MSELNIILTYTICFDSLDIYTHVYGKSSYSITRYPVRSTYAWRKIYKHVFVLYKF